MQFESESARADTNSPMTASHQLSLARALALLPVLLELCLPFVRVGGRLVTHRRGDLEAEVDASAAALDALGGAAPRIHPVDLPGLRDGRAIVTVEKMAPTPAAFPRRAGVPERRPITQMGR